MKKNKNILILEAGGPCGISTIKLLKRNKIGTLYAADMDPYSPAFSLADKAFVIPPTNSVEFTKAISSIISENNIDIAMPTFENGFDKLKSLEKYNEVFVTDFNAAILCKDKYEFSEYTLKKGLPVPKTKFLKNVQDFSTPIYIKPRKGVGSRNNFVINTKEEFQKIKQFLMDSPDEYIVQPLLSGEHWNVDVLVADGKYICAIPRKDLKQKEGNCITVSVEPYNKLIQFAKKVQDILNIQSPFNLEVFETATGFVINEINVRFGGGVIFGALAGVDIVSYTATKDQKYLGKLKKQCFSRYYEEIEVTKRK